MCGPLHRVRSTSLRAVGFALVPASYVYLLHDDAVLLQLRQNTGYMDGCWTAGAAGHIEMGETAQRAAVRELDEELGITVSVVDLRATAVMQRTDGTAAPREQRVDWFFACERWVGTPKIGEPRKCAELRWFGLDNLPRTVPAYERLALNWLREHEGVGLLSTGFKLDG